MEGIQDEAVGNQAYGRGGCAGGGFVSGLRAAGGRLWRLLRRPSGGGAIVHGSDVTLAIALPNTPSLVGGAFYAQAFPLAPGANAAGILATLAGALGDMGSNNAYLYGQPTIAFGPEHAAILAADGYDKNAIRRYVFEHARVPRALWAQGGMAGMFGGGQQPPQPKGNIQPLWNMLGVRFGAESVLWQNYNPYPRFQWIPEFVFVDQGSSSQRVFSDADPITKDMQQLLFLFTGSVSPLNASQLKFRALVTTGSKTGVVPQNRLWSRGFFGGGNINPARVRDYEQTATNYVLAAHIQGKYKDANQMADEEPKAGPGGEAKLDPFQKEAAKETDINVVVVADIGWIAVLSALARRLRVALVCLGGALGTILLTDVVLQPIVVRPGVVARDGTRPPDYFPSSHVVAMCAVTAAAVMIIGDEILSGRTQDTNLAAIAKYLAIHGLEIIDCGTPLLSMHSPFEVASKADLYMTFKAYRAFFQAV